MNVTLVFEDSGLNFYFDEPGRFLGAKYEFFMPSDLAFEGKSFVCHCVESKKEQQ